jgi:hypothetical protein
MQKHQARVSLFTSLFNIIHPCGKQIKAQIACFNQWTAPLEEHFFQEEQAGDEWYSPRSDVPAGHDGW